MKCKILSLNFLKTTQKSCIMFSVLHDIVQRGLNVRAVPLASIP